MPKTIIGLFDDKTEAQQVRQDIVQMGIPRSETSIIENPGPTGMGTHTQSGSEPSFWESLKEAFGFGVPEEEGAYYAEGVRRGGTLVSVRAEDTFVDRVVDIMAQHGAVDIDERSTQWRQSGWTAGTGSETKNIQNQTTGGDNVVMPVVEEELQIGKREVQRGGVRVYSRVTERPVEETVRLREEQVQVERRPVNRPADVNQPAAFKEGVIEMATTAEEPVVSKRARVIEEVVIRKDVKERTETVRDTVRRTDVDVQSMESNQPRTTGSTFADDDTEFRKHYETNFGSRGYTYDQYSPAYRYGTHLAGDTTFGPGDWTTVEPEARRYWEERNAGTWEDFKDAVRHAWEKARQKVGGMTG
jgi:uncharacterized protein (TIGR02271 family)